MSSYFRQLKHQLNDAIDLSDPNQFLVLALIAVVIGFLCLRGNGIKAA